MFDVSGLVPASAYLHFFSLCDETRIYVLGVLYLSKVNRSKLTTFGLPRQRQLGVGALAINRNQHARIHNGIIALQ